MHQLGYSEIKEGAVILQGNCIAHQPINITELRFFMRLPHLLLCVPLFFAVACSSTIPPAAIKAAPIIKKDVLKQDFSKILTGNFRGQFSLEDGQAYFKICATEQTFSVNANAALRNIYEQIAATKSDPVYIEFTGEIIFPEAGNQEQDAIMRIDHVHHMALAKLSLQCAKHTQSFQFKGKGNAPYWRLNITGQKLFFATKARNQVYQVTNANFKTTQINRVKSINDEQQKLDLTIRPSHCYDLKNKEYWGYSAKVDSVWGEFSGCGEPGWLHTEDNFSGYYLNKMAGKISNLTLSKDYSVEYQEQIGTKTLNKSGFWKSNSPDKVVVMLTREGQTIIREELIFHREGLTLNIQQINKDNILTSFTPPGLVFNKMNHKAHEEIVVKRMDRVFTAQNIKPVASIDLDIQKAINQYFEIHRTDPKETQFSSVKYDLNGDGIKDAIVLLDWCSKNGCEMLIFEGIENGYRFSSRISRVHAPIIIAQTQHYLWQSLLIKKETQWFKLDFDGISYPINSRDLQAVNKQEESTGILLFSQGPPAEWFPIKL